MIAFFLAATLFAAPQAPQQPPSPSPAPAADPAPAGQPPSEQPPSGQSPSGQSPSGQPPTAGQPTTEPAADPAAAEFTTPVGLILVPVKPTLTKDYEAAILAMQEAFQKSADPAVRAVAQGWRVYRAAEPDAKSNVLYVHALLPAVAGIDYRPSIVLDLLLNGAPPELLTKYREALAGPPSKLSLTELAHMSAAPVKKEPQ